DSCKLRDHLRSKLAEYMVPAAFVSLERIPLSVNGKVNRKALPTPQRATSGVDSDSDSPRDAVELQLINLWENAIGVRPVRRQDNFFDIGGTSLMAVRLFAQIEKAFGRKIPLAALFKTPTVAQLAEILRADEHAVAWSSVVPFQSGGSRPPLFCVHGHTGEVLFYSHLARNLGPNQPFYALQSRGLTGGEAHLTIEEMATDYVRELRTVQPHGPYYLAGYCFGGRIAFEMALQLREQSERVAFLGVFDTYFPEKEAQESVKSMHRFLESRAANSEPLKRRLLAHLAQLSALGFTERLIHVARHGRNAVAKVRDSLNQRYWRLAFRYHTKVGRPLPRRLQNVPEINLLAAVKYLPTRPAGCLTLLLNGPVPDDFSPNQEFGWRGLLAEKFDVHGVPGKQDAMFQDPNAAVLAETMARCLEKA
ncbi:MAG: alpha/beta fold hydrolase, partial [Candidatus Acidiferrales bacterium]